MMAYNEWFDGLTPDEQYRYRRGYILDTLKKSRATIRKHAWTKDSLLQVVIRPGQKLLLGLRIWRSTGQHPHHA